MRNGFKFFLIIAGGMISFLLFFNISDGGDKIDSIAGIKVKDIEKKEVNLSDYKGKVLLIVNVASKCGNTPQYADLEKLYQEYKKEGLEVLGFPCNDFGEQEPGTNEEIKTFCTSNYNVTFKLFDKVKILGNDKHELYKRLTDNDVVAKGDVKWNFEKFLISRNGKILKRYKSKQLPLSEEIVSDIKIALKG